MAWNYAPLWKILIDRNMKRTDLLSKAKIYSQTLAKMGKNEAVSMDALGRICQASGLQTSKTLWSLYRIHPSRKHHKIIKQSDF